MNLSRRRFNFPMCFSSHFNSGLLQGLLCFITQRFSHLWLLRNHILNQFMVFPILNPRLQTLSSTLSGMKNSRSAFLKCLQWSAFANYRLGNRYDWPEYHYSIFWKFILCSWSCFSCFLSVHIAMGWRNVSWNIVFNGCQLAVAYDTIDSTFILSMDGIWNDSIYSKSRYRQGLTMLT